MQTCFSARPKKRFSRLRGLDDKSRLNAVGADINAFDASLVDRPDPLKVRVEAALGYIVGVTHIVSHQRLFAADLTHL